MWKNEIKSFFLLTNAVWFLLIIYHNAYKLERIEPIFKSLNRLLVLLFMYAGILILLLIFFEFPRISHGRILSFYVLFAIGMFIYRYAFLKMLKFIRSKGYNFRKVLIFGANKFGHQLASALGKDASLGFQVIGFFDVYRNNFPLQAPFYGGINQLTSYLEVEKADELYVCKDHISAELMSSLIGLGNFHLMSDVKNSNHGNSKLIANNH
jgi:undecaprenyl-phosphate galactose phosphotransferase/putative colanic acid biosynthesis UDP-glucose lipid carrier transferase